MLPNVTPQPRSPASSPVLSSRSFIALHSTFGFNCGFVFVEGVRSLPHFVLCMGTSSCCSAICWEDRPSSFDSSWPLRPSYLCGWLNFWLSRCREEMGIVLKRFWKFQTFWLLNIRREEETGRAPNCPQSAVITKRAPGIDPAHAVARSLGHGPSRYWHGVADSSKFQMNLAPSWSDSSLPEGGLTVFSLFS